MKYLSTIISILLYLSLNAQINITDEFNDEGNNRLQRIFQTTKYDNGIIISGRMSNADYEIPVLQNLNTEGEIVWTTGLCLQNTLRNLQEISFTIAEDGFVYATANLSSNKLFSVNNTLKSCFYKIDPKTGKIIWQTDNIHDDRANAHHKSPNHFVDLGASKILLGFNNNNNYIGYLIDKDTGDVLDILNKNKPIPTLIADHNQNLIYQEFDRLYKCNQYDFDSILWETEIDDIDKIYEDKFGDLFVFTTGKVRKIDPVSGNEIWISKSTTWGSYITDLKETNEFIYLSFNYRGKSHYNVSKINKVTGELVWESHQIIDEVYSVNPNASGHSAPMSIDLDCNGDILLCGRYVSENVQMGLMKLDGNDGSKLKEAVITINENINTEMGLFTGVFNTNVIFIGSGVEYNYNEFRSSPILVKTDLDLNIYKQENVPSGILYDSDIVQMISKENTNYFLVQKGAKVDVVKRNEEGNTIWSTSLNIGDYNQADYLAVGNNYTYIATRSIIGEDTELLLCKVSNIDGSLIDKISVYRSDGFPKQTYELEVVDDIAYLYYSNFPYEVSSNIAIYKWSGGEIFDVKYQNVHQMFLEKKDENLVIHYGEDLFLIDNSTVHSINKNTMELDSNYYSGSTVFTEARNTLQDDSVVYIFGKRIYSNEQYILKYNLISKSVIWSKNYSSDGIIAKLTLGEDGYLYAIGKTDGIINLMKISETTGTRIWNKTFDWNSGVLDVIELDLSFDIAENKIFYYYVTEINNANKTLNLTTYDISGNLISETINETILEGIEKFSFLVNQNKSILIGGKSHENCSQSSKGILLQRESLKSSTLSNETFTSDQDISIYPNPINNGELTISINQFTKNTSLFLYNVNGRALINKKYSDYQNLKLNIDNLSTGVYILKIKTDFSLSKHKIIIE